MIRTDYAVRMLQAVALVLGLAVTLWSVGIPGLTRIAQAAQVTSLSDTISTSNPGVGANHTIVFASENGLSIGQTLTITFDAAFGVPTLGIEDVDLATSTSVSGPWGDATLAAAAAADTWGYATTSDTLTFTTPTNWGVASNTAFQIQIGTNATFGSAGNTQVVNPTATTTSYTIDVAGTMTDSGTTHVAILDVVTVSASVNTTFDFTVSGVAGGATVGSTSPTTTTAATAPNALPFGTLSAGVSKTLAHDLSVVTNAKNGFSVTVEQNQDLQSSTGATIDSFIDGAYTDTPAAWQGPSAVVGQDNTYGHWGLTSDDPDFSGTTDRWVAASTTPRTVFQNPGVADGTLFGTGTTRIGYQIQISALQEAGNDYSTQLTYIATPTF